MIKSARLIASGMAQGRAKQLRAFSLSTSVTQKDPIEVTLKWLSQAHEN